MVRRRGEPFVRARAAGAAGVGLALALVMLAGAAGAQPKPAATDDAKRGAREAYARGEAALARQEFPTAVAEFTYADDLLPNDTALEAALEAVTHTSDPKIAVGLFNRIEQRSVGASVTAAAKRATDKLEPNVGRIVIECPTKAVCNAELDSTTVVMGKIRWVVPGTHWLRATVNGGAPMQDGIDVKGGALAVVPLGAMRGPAITEVPETGPAASDGPSPAYFWVGVGLTVVAAGVSVWSTLDHRLKSQDVTSTGCRDNPNANTACARFKSEEDSSGTRTWILWGVTGGLALASAITGLFVVHWRNGHTAIGGVPGGGLGSLGLSAEQRF